MDLCSGKHQAILTFWKSEISSTKPKTILVEQSNEVILQTKQTSIASPISRSELLMLVAIHVDNNQQPTNYPLMFLLLGLQRYSIGRICTSATVEELIKTGLDVSPTRCESTHFQVDCYHLIQRRLVAPNRSVPTNGKLEKLV